MNLKCPQCGLVNWESTTVCERCGAKLSNVQQTESAKPMSGLASDITQVSSAPPPVYSSPESPAAFARRRVEFEYQMLQVPPTISVKAKEARGNEAAYYLQYVVNEQAAKGWEFYRVDTIGVVSNPGCLAGLFGGQQTTTDYYVVTFRKEKHS